MWEIFKSQRRKDLEDKAYELQRLKHSISDLKSWCAFDSPEIGCAMKYLQESKDVGHSVSNFRSKLRAGEFTFEYFVGKDGRGI